LKITWQKIRDIMSWIIMIAMICLLIFTIINTYNAKKSGEAAFLFGYRPVLVLTGSMEPYMMTNSIALTKEVTDISELELDDVITYHVESDNGKLLRITHRIVAIDGDYIYTKGDNNRVIDGYPLTIDNVEAEVITVFNQTAWLAEKWQTTSGKVMIISFTAGAILLYHFARVSLKDWKLRRKAKQAGENEPSFDHSTQEAAEPDQTA